MPRTEGGAAAAAAASFAPPKPPRASVAALAHRTADDYQLRRLLGGEHGKVYLALDKKANKVRGKDEGG